MANLATFDLNLLKILDALLRTHSTVRAAEALHLSQPAVSAALGRLRASLGDELFFRRGQGMEPTAYALSLKAPLHAALGAVETVIAGPQDFDPATATQSFRISGADFFAEMLMPRLADRLLGTAPGMRVHLVDLVPDSYVDTLDRYEVDIALLPAMQIPDWAESRPAFRSSFSVIARRDHPALGAVPDQGTVPLDLFCGLGHVLFSPEGNPTAMGDAALAKLGRTRRVVMTLPVFTGVARSVEGSDLIALLPTVLAHRFAQTMRLRVMRAPMQIAVVQILMVWHRRFSASPAHVWLRDQIAELVAPLDETGECPQGLRATPM